MPGETHANLEARRWGEAQLSLEGKRTRKEKVKVKATQKKKVKLQPRTKTTVSAAIAGIQHLTCNPKGKVKASRSLPNSSMHRRRARAADRKRDRLSRSLRDDEPVYSQNRRSHAISNAVGVCIRSQLQKPDANDVEDLWRWINDGPLTPLPGSPALDSGHNAAAGRPPALSLDPLLESSQNTHEKRHQDILESNRIPTAYHSIAHDEIEEKWQASAAYSASRTRRKTILLHPSTTGLNTETGSNELSKRPLPSRRHLWANTRQELCETLPYYRAFQAGLYMHSGIARGYLLDGFPALRDTWVDGGKVIISHGGGKCRPYKLPDGSSVPILREDQSSDDARVAALLNAYRYQRPLVLIAGKGYKNFPFRLGEAAYVVLGWYFISAVWVEAEFCVPEDTLQANTDKPYYHRYKIRFDWCDGQGDPWFRAQSSQSGQFTPTAVTQKTYQHDETQRKEITEKRPAVRTEVCLSHADGGCLLPSASCCICKRPSFMPYGVFICFETTCPRFWTHPTSSARTETTSEDLLVDPRSTLQLDPSFLTHMTSLSRVITPPFDLYTIPEYQGVTAQGIVCVCGRIYPRSDIAVTRCPSCQVAMRTCLPAISRQPVVPVYGQIDSFISATVSMTPHFLDVEYHFDDVQASLHHLRPTSLAIPDRLLEGYKAAAAVPDTFIRSPSRSHILQTTMLSQHFTLNSGQPYKYATVTRTRSFADSPEVVQETFDYVQQLTPPRCTFNELLSVVYLPGQAMDFHTDDEAGLGPTIAAISLGSDCRFAVRRRRKRQNKHVFRSPTASPKTASSHNEQQQKPSTGSNAVAAQMPCLSITLIHGDILIMTGDGLQREYEHAATPSGFRIAATARWIDEEHTSQSASKTRRRRRPDLSTSSSTLSPGS